MASTTVAQLAAELNRPPAALLEQLKSAGVSKASANDSVTESDKARLLDHLRSAHGTTTTGERKKITLTRKSTSEIKQADSSGKARTIQVEVRKKRTFVKRDDVPAAPPEDAVSAEAREEDLRRREEEAHAEAERLRAQEEELAAQRRQREEQERAQREAAEAAEARARGRGQRRRGRRRGAAHPAARRPRPRRAAAPPSPQAPEPPCRRAPKPAFRVVKAGTVENEKSIEQDPLRAAKPTKSRPRRSAT
jgi:translation initiation factor IF-2